MNALINNIVSFIGSATFGVILTILILVQWDRQHAKEQTVKNNLFAMRRKVERWKADKDIEPGRAADVVEDIDAILATLGARGPFKKAMDFVIRRVIASNETQASKPLQQVSPFNF